MYFKFPSVLDGWVWQLGVLCPTAHVLSGVTDGGDVVDDAQGHVAVWTCLKRMKQVLEEVYNISVVKGFVAWWKDYAAYKESDSQKVNFWKE